MKNSIKRSLACLLVLVLCLSMIDLSTFTSTAADGAEVTASAPDASEEPNDVSDTDDFEKPTDTDDPEEPADVPDADNSEEPTDTDDPEEPTDAPDTDESGELSDTDDPEEPTDAPDTDESEEPTDTDDPEEPEDVSDADDSREPENASDADNAEEPADVHADAAEEPDESKAEEERAARIKDLLSRIEAALADLPDPNGLEGTEEEMEALNELGMTLSDLYEECFEYEDDEKVSEAQEKLEEAIIGLQELLGLAAEALAEESASVALVGEQTYATLAEAIEAVKTEKGAVITLTADKVQESITIPSGAEITLDLNGKTLTGTMNGERMTDVITNHGTLTIQDTAEGGCVVGGSDTSQANNAGRGGIAVVNCEDGTCTILSGTIRRGDQGTFGNYTVKNMGTMYIKGGLITNNSNISNLVINFGQKGSSYIDGYAAKMYISGGTIRQDLMSALKNDPGTYMEISGTAALIERQDTSNPYAYACNLYGTVVMTGGTIRTKGVIPVLSWKEGTTEFASSLTVSGGTIECTEIRVINGFAPTGTVAPNVTGDYLPVLTITGGDITADKICIWKRSAEGNLEEVADGTMARVAVSGGTFSSPVSAEFLADGYKQNAAGQILPAEEAGIGVLDVASVGGRGYATLKEAVEAVPAGTQTTVKIEKDITGMKTEDIVTIPAGKDIVLDMNGKSITVDSGFTGRPVVNMGTLRITGSGTIDSSASSAGGYGAVNNQGTLHIENGTFRGATGASGSAIRNTGASAVLVIENGTFEEAFCAVYNEGTATLKGGTYTGTTCNSCTEDYYSYTIRNVAETSHMVIDGGTYTGTQGAVSAAIGYLEVNGGTFQTVDCAKNHGAVFYALYAAGELGKVQCIINGGMFKCGATADKNRPAVLIGNDNTDGDGGINADAVSHVYGGIFKAAEGVSALQVSEKTAAGSIIHGGKYSSLDEGLSKYLDPDMKMVKGEMVEVRSLTEEDEDAAVKAGDKVYTSLEEALAHAGSGSVTLTLLKNMQESVVIPSGAEITLELNGKTLTGTLTGEKMENVITNHGTLTIQDTAGGGCVAGGKDTGSGDAGRKGIAVVNREDGVCTILSGTIQREDEGTFGTYVVQNEGEMRILGGTVQNSSNKSSLVANFGTMDIQGGTFEQKSYITLMNKPNAALNISGGKISGDTTDGSEVIQAYGTVNISGGEVTGNSIGVWAYDDPDKFGVIRSKLSVSGDAVINVSEVRTVAWDPQVGNTVKPSVLPELVVTGSPQISGRLIIAQKTGNNGPVNSPVTEVPEAEEKSFGSILVSGGTFAQEPKASYLAEGFTTVLADGKYKVTEEPGENPPEEPGDDPSEEPGENPPEEPEDNPSEEPGENPPEEPGDNPSEEPGENPPEEPGDNPSGEPGENPPEEPGDNPSEEPGDNPSGRPSGGSGGSGGGSGSGSGGGESTPAPAPVPAPAAAPVPAAAPAAVRTAQAAAQPEAEAAQQPAASVTEADERTEDTAVPAEEEETSDAEENLEVGDEETPLAPAPANGGSQMLPAVLILAVLLAAGLIFFLFIKRRKENEEA